MAIEYEAKFIKIDKDDIRKRLIAVGGQLVRPEFLQRRIPFYLPDGKRSKDSWLRVRDEGDKVTMSLKIIDGDGIANQHELCLTIDSFDEGVKFLDAIGCERKSYQETKRELWRLGDADVTIDEWPFLEPFVEVEAPSEAAVRAAAEKLGFDYAHALFGGVAKLYHKKYGVYPDEVNTIKKIVFDMENPFPSISPSLHPDRSKK